MPDKPTFDCPHSKDWTKDHCPCWWEGQPCDWCRDNTPDPTDDSARDLAEYEQRERES